MKNNLLFKNVLRLIMVCTILLCLNSAFAQTGPTGPTGATGAGYLTTATLRDSVSSGSKTFTVQAGLAYLTGSYIRASATDTSYEEGTITSYSGTQMKVTITRVVNGSPNIFTNWNIAIAGVQGASGPTGPAGAKGAKGATGAAGSANAWSLTGNRGTIAGTNFIGTLDSANLEFEVNGQFSGLIDNNSSACSFFGYKAGAANSAGGGTSNSAFGYTSLNKNTTGSANTAIGADALLDNTTGAGNTGAGVKALNENTTGSQNTAVGEYALGANNSGYTNSALGYGALYSNTTGYSNVAMGIWAMRKNTTAANMVAIGDSALYNLNSGKGYGNTAVGSKALFTTTGSNSNSAFGYATLSNTTSGAGNSATGFVALAANTSGSFNTANGAGALSANTIGANNSALGYAALSANLTGSSNAAVGYGALSANTSGYSNSALGYQALGANTTGHSNIAIGDWALSNNKAATNQVAIGDSALMNANLSSSASANTAVGSKALLATTTGGGNAAFGQLSLLTNTSGAANTSVGLLSLSSNVIGSSNTAVGAYALSYTTGDHNVGVGDNSGGSIVSGTGNTCIGSFSGGSGFALDTGENYTAIGFYAGNGAKPASNYFDIGSSSVNHIRAEVTGITAYSDARIKDNIQENVPGLAFIKHLRPVTYNLNIHKQYNISHNGKADTTANWHTKYDIEKIRQTGFIAQEVEKAATGLNYDFNGLHKPNSASDLYGLNYTSFVVPIVKAVQELSTQNDSLANALQTAITTNDLLKTEIQELKASSVGLQTANDVQQTFNKQMASRLDQFESSLSQCCSNTQPGSGQASPNTFNNGANGNTDVPSLQQNVPNPFNSTTYIQYYLPSTSTTGALVITDMNGRVLKQYNISSTGFGKQTIAAGQFAQGTYNYTLFADGKMVATKQMVLTR